MAYPSSLDSFPTILSSTKQNDSGFEADLLLNQAFDAIENIEAGLGTGASNATPVANTVRRATGTGTAQWGQVATGDIANNAVTVSRPSTAVGSTDPTTTNTSTAALANPTVSVVIPSGVTADVYVWLSGLINDGTGGAIVEYHLRIGGGSWVSVASVSTPSSAGRFPLSGFHVFEDITAGTKVIEVGNSSSTGSNTITHYGAQRRLVAVAVAK